MTSGIPRATYHQQNEIRQAAALYMPRLRPDLQGLLPAGGHAAVPEVRGEEGVIMARTLTPERQKLKQEAISLRYDYGLTERRIVDQLNLPKTTIHQWLVYNSHTGLVYNIQHLEGDCLEKLKDLPDKSVDGYYWTGLVFSVPQPRAALSGSCAPILKMEHRPVLCISSSTSCHQTLLWRAQIVPTPCFRFRSYYAKDKRGKTYPPLLHL